MSTRLYLEIIGAVVVGAGVTVAIIAAFQAIDNVAARRRLERRIRLERAMRAKARCAHCGSIGAVEFRTRTAELLREVEQSDTGRTISALFDYGRKRARRQEAAS